MVAMPRAEQIAPIQITVRMYQVGFGDCFLLTFGYPVALADGRDKRHILIDMGSNRPPTGGTLDFETIANDIKHHVDTTLDVVVLSHRHKDHLAGFGNDSAGAVLDALQRKLVVRAWTEDPDKHDEPAVKALRNIETISSALVEGLRGALGVLAARQSGNAKAVTRLDTWAKAAEAAEYLSFGMQSRIPEFVPGIRVYVLGPPLPKVAPDVIRERSWNQDQYWLTRLGLVDKPAVASTAGVRANTSATDVSPGPIRWIVDRLGSQHTASAMRLVHEFDKAMNNTSVILLIEAGTKRLLFGGDAQWESWEYALTKAPRAQRDEYSPLLANLDLYKVGHHGSLNATPKQSLYGLWKAQAARERGMMALISTCCGVYPHGRPVPAETASRVPRLTLLESLQSVLNLYSTTDLGENDLYLEVAADLTNAEPFKVVSPAALAPKRGDLCPPFDGHSNATQET
jgi:beta-lactamase superfamily II metal-dependent hydrolase